MGSRFGALAWCMLLLAPTAGAVTVRVGSDPACEAFSLAGAIARLPNDGPSGSHFILLSRNATYTAPTALNQRSVTIEGGYDNCSDPTPDVQTPTLIGPTAGTQRSLAIAGFASGERFHVRLRNLDFDRAAGGALSLSDRVQVTLSDTLVRRSSAVNGGGITVDGDALALIDQRTLLVLDGSSRVEDNVASGLGGGIHCIDGAEVRLLGSDVGVVSNRAQNGGGLALINCVFDWTNPASGAQFGISANDALATGGGILAIDGGMRFAGNGSASAVLSGNSAQNGSGGGIFASGTQINADGLALLANRAGFEGGGMLLTNQGFLILGRYAIAGNTAGADGGGLLLDDADAIGVVDDSPCTAGSCRRIEFNGAGESNTPNAASGGGLLLRDGATADLAGLRIDSNTAPRASAIALENATLDLANASVGRNIATTSGAPIGSEAIRAAAGSVLALTQVTLAANRVAGLQTATIRATTSSVIVRNSIVFETSGSAFAVTPANSLGGACVLAHEAASSTGTFLTPFVADPQLTSNNDFRLRPTSPAIDRCASGEPPRRGATDRDIESNLRPVDDAGIADVAGPYDAGAFERLGQPQDAVFANGYE